MPNESTMICIDNSDWMRNGDFVPTRLQAQQDAVSVICRAKNRESPENNFGVTTLTDGKVLTTLTTEMGKVLTRLHMVEPNGQINLVTGLRVAHIALKHRSSKSHKMRIVAFVGSPVVDEEDELIKLGKRLKKENVVIDIVNFGELDINSEKLEKFVNLINGKGGSSCHLVNVEPSSSILLSDALMTSPVIGASGDYTPSGFPAVGGTEGGGFDFGVDPTQDPDLALALRVSMEEERQRQESEARRAMEQSAKQSGPVTGGAGESAVAVGSPLVQPDGPVDESAEMDPEEAMLAQALHMSLQQSASEESAQQDVTEDMEEDDDLALAMQMSLQQGLGGASTTAATSGDATTQLAAALQAEELESMETDGGDSEDDIENQLEDPDVLRSVLSSLPGVNPDSATIQAVLESAAQQHQKKQEKKDDEPMDES